MSSCKRQSARDQAHGAIVLLICCREGIEVASGKDPRDASLQYDRKVEKISAALPEGISENYQGRPDGCHCKPQLSSLKRQRRSGQTRRLSLQVKAEQLRKRRLKDQGRPDGCHCRPKLSSSGSAGRDYQGRPLWLSLNNRADYQGCHGSAQIAAITSIVVPLQRSSDKTIGSAHPR